MSIEGLVFDETTQISTKLMEMSMERQRLIANNIANVNTPGYTKQDIDFEAKLAEIVKSGNLDELKSFQGEIVKDTTDKARLDGNNVVIPNELNDMTQNGVYYNLLTKAFNTKMKILKSAIK